MSGGQVLSQSEVDALLNAVSEGKVDTAPPPAAASDGGAPVVGTQGWLGGIPDSEITPYDLTNQDRVIRGRMPTLDIIYERFIRLYRISLSNALRKFASISIISTDLLKFGEFVNTLPIPSCMCIMRFEALKGPALLVFESKLAYALIDSFFGGTDRPFTKIEGKEFTRSQLSQMQKVMELPLDYLEQAWPTMRAELALLRTEPAQSLVS